MIGKLPYINNACYSMHGYKLIGIHDKVTAEITKFMYRRVHTHNAELSSNAT